MTAEILPSRTESRGRSQRTNEEEPDVPPTEHIEIISTDYLTAFELLEGGILLNSFSF